MTTTLVLATNNQGKLRELTEILQPLNYNVRSQADWQVSDAEENGLTFVENALIKARHASKITGQPCIADDSGLVVDALDGAPGIYSARYAGQHGDDDANIQHLLSQMHGLQGEQRRAKFVCCLVYLRHADDPLPVICLGQWAGQILTEPQGEGGFGYDPVFFVEQFGCTAAQMDKADKNRVSHRGQALQALLSQLRTGI